MLTRGVESPCGCTPSICLLHVCLQLSGPEGHKQTLLTTQSCCPLPGSASAQLSEPGPFKCCLEILFILIPSTGPASCVGLVSKYLFISVLCATSKSQLQLSGLAFPSFLFTDVSQRQITCSPHLPGGCGVWLMNLSLVLILKGRHIEYVRMKDF